MTKEIIFTPSDWDKSQINKKPKKYKVCVFSGWGKEHYIEINGSDVKLIDENTASIILKKPNMHNKYEFFSLEAI